MFGIGKKDKDGKQVRIEHRGQHTRGWLVGAGLTKGGPSQPYRQFVKGPARIHTDCQRHTGCGAKWAVSTDRPGATKVWGIHIG
jgi:hypothetical protein